MTARTLALPWRSFYWAVLTPPGSLRGDLNRPEARAALDEVFERDLPVPLDAVETRYWRPQASRSGDAAEGMVIGCAIDRSRLEGFIAAEELCIVLGPRDLPPVVRTAIASTLGDTEASVESLRVEALNFLTGEYLPGPIAAASRNSRRTVLVGIAAGLAIAAGGLWLRAQAARHDAQATRLATANLLMEGAGGVARSPDEARLRLVAERSVLQQSRGDAASGLRPRDAADGLAAILAAWPNQLELRTAALQVTSKEASFSVEVHSTVAAEAFTAAITNARGWRLTPPQTDANGSVVRVTSRLSAVVESPSPRGSP